MQEMQVWALDQEAPLEKEMATHSSVLAWKNPPEGLTVHGVTKSQTQLSNWAYMQFLMYYFILLLTAFQKVYSRHKIDEPNFPW